ncbi:acyltransferase domain-containing protein [Nocardiopsis coralliicola]
MNSTDSARKAADRFALPGPARAWFSAAASLPDHPDAVAADLHRLTPDRLHALLEPFALAAEDLHDITALWSGPVPGEAVWMAGRMAAAVARDAGTAPAWVDWPRVSGLADPHARTAPLIAFALAVPAHLRAQAADGTDPATTRATLRDVGRQTAAHRRMFGTAGLDTTAWVAHLFRSGFYELGRLQYEPNTLGEQGAVRWLAPAEHAAAGGDPRLAPGAPALRLHIPGGEPLDPERTAASLRRARPFFDGWHPAGFTVATCSSWLLDPQLRGYLPAGSNILAFQDLFHLVEQAAPGDSDVHRFVFDRAEPVAPARLPRRTRVERAAAGHLAAGGHWQVRTGWLFLPGG